MKAAVLAILVLIAPGAWAQLGVPQLPTLPRVELPAQAGRLAPALDPRSLTDLRRLRVRELLRRERERLEPDPRGAPMVRSELLALSPTDAALAKARGAGFEPVRERVLAGLGARIVVLRAPEGMSTRRALSRLRALDPDGRYDFNHVYLDSSAVEAAPAAEPSAGAHDVPAGGAIGLVDGGVEGSHPVFAETSIRRHGCDGRAVPSGHGTGVASLLVGRASGFHGALPGAVLYAADVYCGESTGGAMDRVAEALGWMAAERVPVINLSLVGPPNVLLESVVRMLIERGHLVVAAVGNDGPAAAPLYPASYPDVIGVSAVDGRERVLPEAARGKQVDFAAPGADMAAAGEAAGFSRVRGTSFAAPLVAGLLASRLHTPDPVAARAALDALIAGARDRGTRGRDPVYGYGLVGEELRPDPALAGSR